MFKSRFLLVLGITSLVLVSLAISSFRSHASLSNREAASDFAQRHLNWTWSAAVPAGAYSDYYERHPELNGLSSLGQAASDYAQRHPELSALAAPVSIDLTDYYFRHLSK